jgi:Abnormal spindle-like microcephaly-assoc'd, ASPM-SPD-2-Hydin
MYVSFCPPLGLEPESGIVSPAAGCSSPHDGRAVRSSVMTRGSGRLYWALLLFFPWLSLAFSGCGGTSIGGAATSGLQISPGSLSFGSVSIGKTVTANVSVVNLNSAAIEISAIYVTGKGFTASAQNNLPITVAAAGGTYSLSVAFDPAAAGAASGSLTVTTNSGADSTAVVGLTGMGLTAAPVISAFTCSSSSVPESGTDTCSVSLSAAAGSGGMQVDLTSSSTALSVPASITVAAGATSTSFQATAATVNSTQTVALTASAGGASDSTDVEVEVANPSLTFSAASLTFGNEAVNTPVTQTVTVNSTGAAAVTIDSATISGTGFTVSAPALPLTLSPGSSTTFTVRFDPSAAGAVTGQLTIASDSSSSNAVSLSGNGIPVLTGLSCTDGSMTGSGTDPCTVTLNTAAATGGFTVNLASSDSAVSVPSTVTVAAGASSEGFSATVSGVSTAQTATLTASAGSTTEQFSVELNAVVATLAGLSCTDSSLTGSGTDACTVTLSSAAASGGFTVDLASNNSAVSVPPSVTVTSGSSTAGFSATFSAVSTSQPVTLTASAGTVSKTFALELNANVATLTINASSIAFGDISLNTTATQSVTLTSTGAIPVIVSSVTISGTGFTFSGASFPLTLNSTSPTSTLSVDFDPTTAGSATGELTVSSNSSINGTANISLTGTGVSSSGTYEVSVTWDPPSSSSDAVAGYNIYRSIGGESTYQLMGSVTSTALSFTDNNNIQNGQTYDYIVESVDGSGNESVPSNLASVVIP